MEEVRVLPAVLDAVVAHARRELPNECCGLLVGSSRFIEEAVASANVLAHPAQYRIDPAVHFSVVRRLRGSPRAVVGAYHSHPRTEPIPSPTDVAEAYYPEFVWLIVSLADSQPRFRAWRIATGHVAELKMVTDRQG